MLEFISKKWIISLNHWTDLPNFELSVKILELIFQTLNYQLKSLNWSSKNCIICSNPWTDLSNFWIISLNPWTDPKSNLYLVFSLCSNSCLFWFGWELLYLLQFWWVVRHRLSQIGNINVLFKEFGYTWKSMRVLNHYSPPTLLGKIQDTTVEYFVHM
jgi:hypothetical protein